MLLLISSLETKECCLHVIDFSCLNNSSGMHILFRKEPNSFCGSKITHATDVVGDTWEPSSYGRSLVDIVGTARFFLDLMVVSHFFRQKAVDQSNQAIQSQRGGRFNLHFKMLKTRGDTFPTATGHRYEIQPSRLSQFILTVLLVLFLLRYHVIILCTICLSDFQ